jgi:uncharacterized protein
MWGLATVGIPRVALVTFVAHRRGTNIMSSARSIVTSTTPLAAATRFLLQYDYVPDVLEKRGPYREGHLGLAKELISTGKCLSGGPTGPPGAAVPTGALFIFSDREAAEHFVEQDPYVANGIVTGHNIQEWTVVVEKENS